MPGIFYRVKATTHRLVSAEQRANSSFHSDEIWHKSTRRTFISYHYFLSRRPFFFFFYLIVCRTGRIRFVMFVSSITDDGFCRVSLSLSFSLGRHWSSCCVCVRNDVISSDTDSHWGVSSLLISIDKRNNQVDSNVSDLSNKIISSHSNNIVQVVCPTPTSLIILVNICVCGDAEKRHDMSGMITDAHDTWVEEIKTLVLSRCFPSAVNREERHFKDRSIISMRYAYQTRNFSMDLSLHLDEICQSSDSTSKSFQSDLRLCVTHEN